ncbi:salivary peroxidase/catechol oxidase-like [Haliotis cracherodii]|uniref:salivary peroxidase/catechol oxidase-like n=1 Tax=Haliotis cracherodii TaxID=6455 RepID=UPI0039EBB013
MTATMTRGRWTLFAILITAVASKKSILPTVYDAESAGQIASSPRTDSGHTSGLVKRQTCEASRFRTIDGVCNNMNNPLWGSVNRNFRRVLPAVYNDANGTPRLNTASGVPLPTARTVSNNVHFELNRTSNRLSVMAMQWGQFLDHDLTGTPVTTNNGDKIECCNVLEDATTDPSNPCFPISLPFRDANFPTKDCMNFVRSEPAEVAPGAPREQKNSLTSFIDGSQIYGASTVETAKLIDLTGGLLKVTSDNLLPAGEGTACALDPNDTADYCFLAGDSRVNVFPGLSALHTLFVREHNRIATTLASLQPSWSHETLFNEARKIVGAQLQVITYNQWLPEIIGRDAMTSHGLTSGDYSYDQTVDPSLANVFSTASFRFGHTMIPKTMRFENDDVSLTKMYNRPSYVRKNINSIFEGLLGGANERVDAWYADEMRNHLFETTAESGLDIVSLNIQRGRDHGLPAYNAWRHYCQLPNVTYPTNNVFSGRAGRDIERTYTSPDDIDLYTGGVSEAPVGGAAVGSLYICLLGEQFADLKYGDSYWYETTDPVKGFTTEQIASLEQVSLSRIICDNTDINSIQTRPFRLPEDNNNQVVDCSSTAIASLDLSLWGPTGQTGENTPDPQASQPTQPPRRRPDGRRPRPPKMTGGKRPGRRG